jgi:hypothetical protein
MSTTIKSANKRRKVSDTDLPLNQDIWVNNILPFLGMGHFAFVAGVNRQMKEHYKAFCDNVENPPKVKRRRDGETELATNDDTFYRAVFSSVACAEFWYWPAKKYETCRLIAKTGNLEVMKWAHKKKLWWHAETCEEAASGGHLEILKYATENDCPWNLNAATCARYAKNGLLEVLKYAHENQCPWDEETCNRAAVNGHLEVLKYAYESSCPWDTYACKEAAEHGHLNVLKYLHEHGCPWDESTCAHTVKTSNNLAVLKYLHENGCPWDSRTYHWAAMGSHYACLKYAEDNGCSRQRDQFSNSYY